MEEQTRRNAGRSRRSPMPAKVWLLVSEDEKDPRAFKRAEDCMRALQDESSVTQIFEVEVE